MNKFFVLFLSLMICIPISACKNRKIIQYRSYGIDYLENMNYEEALNYFDEAIKAGNGTVGNLQYDLLLYKAECLFMLKRYDEAKKIYEVLLKIDKFNKNYKELYDNINNITYLIDFKKYLDNNDVDKAEELLMILKEKGLEHEKSVMFNQAVLYEKKAEWKDALNSFNYYLKQYPGDEAALHEIEFINAELGNSN